VIAEGGYYGMQTFDQHLLQHLQAGRISMADAMQMATSPHDFKLMIAAGGKPKGEGQAQGPGAPRQAAEGMGGVATIAPPAPVAAPAVAAYQSAPPPGA